jgi:hypothetical protein
LTSVVAIGLMTLSVAAASKNTPPIQIARGTVVSLSITTQTATAYADGITSS